MVLFVDDDADLLEMIGLLFKQFKVSHVLARSLAAVQALGDQVQDITTAILDVNLGPGQPTGVAVAKWLQERNRRVRIHFLTGHAADHPLVVEASHNGEVMAKPFDTRKLVDIARNSP